MTRVSFMVTCLGDVFYPEVGVRIVRLLRRLGVEVDFPDAQTCCGLPLFNSGYHGEAAEVARRTIELFGAEHVELPASDECCGFGGSYSVRLPEVSSAILERKLKNLEASGARCLVACDAGCLMQIRGGLSRRGSPLQALHLAEVIAAD